MSFLKHQLTFLLLQSLVKSTSPTIGYTSDIEGDVEVPSAHEQEFSFCDLFTFPITISESIANYFKLAFLNIASNALLPIFVPHADIYGWFGF